jgi:aryl-alcohol dehydrogenase-like predicted oxidoreductase
MREIDFKPLGRSLPFVGFGCGTLTGRVSLRRSARLVETALDLGIRYFDVAPSYGQGTAEEVLGHVIGDAKDVVIATKHGIPRPEYRAAAQTLRWLVKPAVDRFIPVKRLLRGALRAPLPPPRIPVRHDFSRAAIYRSIETSLRLLKRSRVDVFLAHEPCAADLTQDATEAFDELVRCGVTTCYGVGVGAMSDWTVRFGNVWQSAWAGESVHPYKGGATYVFHGALRTAGKADKVLAARDVSDRFRVFAHEAPQAMLLVSASTPERLKQLVQAARN